MRAVTVVMVNEHLEGAQKMPALRDQQPVQTFGPNRSDEAFRHRVRCGRSPCRPHHLDTSAAKHRVELTREFLVAISDEKSRWFDPLRERPRELASLLRHPLCGGMARAARQVHATARELNEEEHISRWSQTVSTVKKSTASIVRACVRMNSRHAIPPRLPAGPSPASRSTLRIVVPDTVIPSPFSSPTIR